MASPKDRSTAKLSPDQSRAVIPRLRKRRAELEAFDPHGRTRTYDPEAQGLVDRYDATLSDIFGSDSDDYARYRVTSLFGLTLHPGLTSEDWLEGYTLGQEWALAKVRSAITDLEERLEYLSDAAPRNEAGTAAGAHFPPFTDFRNALLVALAKCDEERGPEYYELKEVAEGAGLKYREGWVGKAANYFDKYGYVSDAFTMGGGVDGGLSVQLTAEGLEEAERLMAETETSEIVGQHPEAAVPASDRYVELDHNSPEFREATEAVRAVIERVRSDNEYNATDPEDKQQRLAELEAGSTLLKSIRVRAAAVTAVLVPPLRYLAKKFLDTAIGKAASIAVTAVMKLLGL